ncbi:MAG: hypothetical protein BGP13_16180 [Sphingobacteriales bacterium 40-81]|nr:MAG: hypothetical protein BGP13_16180 [Sphingobacteriales bacterium 40-81]
MLFILILVSAGIKTIAQNSYYDAMRLKKYTNKDGDLKSTEDSVYFILDDYIQHEKKNTIHEIDSILRKNKNPFFILSGAARSQANDNKIGSFFRGTITSVGNLDVTSIADGLAQFLIKRGKEELNIAFFQRMKEFLEKNVEAKTLFPSTVQFLGKIASYRYSEFLPTLREAFYKDINNLIVNLSILIDLPKYQDLLKALPEIRVAIRSAKIISELSQPDSSMHPANLISHLAHLKEWGEMNVNLQNSWNVLDKISESVREKPYIIDTTYDTTKSIVLREISRLMPGSTITDTVKSIKGFYSLKRTIISDTLVKFDTTVNLITSQKFDTIINTKVAWIKFSDFNKNILSDPIALKIYLGLLYQKMDTIAFRDGKDSLISIRGFMDSNKTNIFRIADLIENFLVLANDVEQSIKTLKDKKGNLTNDDYYTYIQKAIDVIDYGFKVANTIKDGIADDRYIKMARNAEDLYKNIYTKNYNAAVMNGYSILEEVLTKYDIAIHEKEKRIRSSLLSEIKNEAEKTSIGKDLKKLYLVHRDPDTLKEVLKDSISLSKISDTTLRKNLSVYITDITKVTRNPVKLDSIVEYLQTFAIIQAVPDSNANTVEKILRYGNLMASIVKAESSEEAQAAIEAAVLPAGSSSIKKNTAWNFSLNAYIGGYFGRPVNTTNQIDGNNSKAGVTAPVGLAVSKGLWHYKNGNPIGSISLYGTLIDVGAIAGYRLNNDSTALDSKITLNDIFAPGGYLVYGLGLPFKWASYVPLSVGYGWQYSSKLYQKKDNGKLAISDKSRWRSNWFVAIDIPLVNFYSRNYKK